MVSSSEAVNDLWFQEEPGSRTAKLAAVSVETKH